MTDGTDNADDLEMEALFTPEVIAVHEAAHAVIRYRTLGTAGGRVSIVRRVDALGGSEDMFYGSGNPDFVESRIMSCYAGGHAQRAFDARCGDWRCWHDDDQAAELLREFGWEAREKELRDRSLTLVQQHWSEIVAVAEELLRVRVLHEAEIEIVADAAGGKVDPEPLVTTDLAAYRQMRGDDLEQWRQRQITGDPDDPT